jgi:hypothetical protein
MENANMCLEIPCIRRDPPNANREFIASEQEICVQTAGGNRRCAGNGYPLRHDLTPVYVRIEELKPPGQQTRRHPKLQIPRLAAGVQEFGFVLPIVVDAARRVVSGWALVAAAQQLGLGEVPVVTLHDLKEVQHRMLRLALNRLSEDTVWDGSALFGSTSLMSSTATWASIVSDSSSGTISRILSPC